MLLVSKYIKGILVLLCVIDIYSKHTWLTPLKKKGIKISNAFQKHLDESGCK